MWPASRNVAWMPARDLALLAVVDRVEVLDGLRRVVGRVERLVEVDLDLRRLGPEVRLDVEVGVAATALGGSVGEARPRTGAGRVASGPPPRRTPT